jgi:hypothetical protein
MLDDLSNSSTALIPVAQNLKFEREDWTLFRTIEGLQQKAGVPIKQLTRLVLKELADNGLDAGAKVEVGRLDDDAGYFVADDGPGIDGTPDSIARLFSIRRPMVSSKLLRLPTRGALGNGLRVVAGAVLASDGKLVVKTRGSAITLKPERDGTTTVVSVEAINNHIGTRIEISFGPDLPCDIATLSWAKRACLLSEGESQKYYKGATSPHWYDKSQFQELLSASGDVPVRELIAQFEGCSGAKAGEIVGAAGLARARCADLTSDQASYLLTVAQGYSKKVKPARLGAIGRDFCDDGAYAIVEGESDDSVSLPFVVEAWAFPNLPSNKTVLQASVNRTPITGQIRAARDGRDIDFYGCGLHHNVAAAPKKAEFFIFLNIITPHMPITSDGKAPNFLPFHTEICEAVGKAVRKAHCPDAKGHSQKDVILEHLDEVVDIVSGGHRFRFNQRQLLYKFRPIIKRELDDDLTTQNFTSIITDYESEHGEIPLMYREPRGSIYHPHKRETVTLGTLMVEKYERPAWTFNKLVFIEKEGWSEALKEIGWPERHDCMLMSSKGFTTRAAKDLVDKLAEMDEPVDIYCAHDADAHGGIIYQTFQEATKARGARKIKIINLGLEPWEAVEMGLEIEKFKPKSDKRRPVADYVLAREDKAPDGQPWESWLQTHRIELNAMDTPQFIAWLDRKMIEHGAIGKLVPPEEVITAELNQEIETAVRAAITERILRDAKLDDQVTEALKAIKLPSGNKMTAGIRELFKHKAKSSWRDHISRIVADILKKKIA